MVDKCHFFGLHPWLICWVNSGQKLFSTCCADSIAQAHVWNCLSPFQKRQHFFYNHPVDLIYSKPGFQHGALFLKDRKIKFLLPSDRSFVGQASEFCSFSLSEFVNCIRCPFTLEQTLTKACSFIWSISFFFFQKQKLFDSNVVSLGKPGLLRLKVFALRSKTFIPVYQVWQGGQQHMVY